VGERESAAGLFGLVALMGLCCGLPILASIGVLGAIAGLSVGSWLLIAGGVVVAAVGIMRWRQNASTCETPLSVDDLSSLENEFDDRTI
jgi:hypothetical protein